MTTSYVKSNRSLALALVREGSALVWRRVRTVGDGSTLSTDDRRVIYPCEVRQYILLPYPEELTGMFGCRDLALVDGEHAAVAEHHHINWTPSNP